jgi:hypothetical protein
LDWAYDDARDLNDRLQAFFKLNPHESVTEFDPDVGQYAHRIKITAAPPPEIRKLVFRVLCDLRHFFDQLTYSATWAVLGEPPNGDLFFPWAMNPTDLEYRLKKIPAVLHPVFRGLEPYPTGDGYEGGDTIIFHLRKIAGPNKHRVTLDPSVRATGFSFQGKISGDYRVPYEGWDAAKNEFTVAWMEPGAERDYTVQVSFNISLGEVPALDGIPILDLIRHFGAYAGHAYGDIATELARLGHL